MKKTIRTLPAIALALSLGIAACGGNGGSDASSSRSPGGGGAPAPTEITVAASAPEAALDACGLLDPKAIDQLTGLKVGTGTKGAAIGSDSRCEFLSPDGATDVAVQVGRKDGGTPGTASPLLTKDGFEQTFGGSEPVDGLDHEGFGFLDDSLSVAQAAVVSTDGQEYVLVTLTGFDLTRDDVDVAAQLVAAVEAAR